jgi:hypothetical protein
MKPYSSSRAYRPAPNAQANHTFAASDAAALAYQGPIEPKVRFVEQSCRIAKSSLSLLQGYNLVSYIEFDSDDDRAYFVKQDEAHQELIKFLDGKLDKGIMVFDFIDGQAGRGVHE